MAERPPRGYFLSARTLTNAPNFWGEAQTWHVIGTHGVDAKGTARTDAPVVRHLPFASLVTVTDKQGSKLKISSPVVGWVPVADLTGNVLMAKGGHELGVKWRFRVVCGSGATVRRGIELTTDHLTTLPWHSVVEVLERRINEAGIPRLRIAEGWISEVLNPLSGQRGPVVEIVQLLRPLLYRVVLPDGAVVRRSVELASPHVRSVAFGEIIQVSAKQFSDLGHRCVQRLKLSDGSGWVSMRLNKDPPEDTPVLEFLAVAETTLVPSAPPLSAYQGNSGFLGRAIGSRAGSGDAGAGTLHAGINKQEEIDEQAKELAKVKGHALVEDDHCVVCLSGPRTATIVHGEIGHIACCLECARILKARGDDCPVCRVPIDRVVQHFWA